MRLVEPTAELSPIVGRGGVNGLILLFDLYASMALEGAPRQVLLALFIIYCTPDEGNLADSWPPFCIVAKTSLLSWLCAWHVVLWVTHSGTREIDMSSRNQPTVNGVRMTYMS